MKLNKLFIAFAASALLCVCSCESSDRTTGNEEAAHAGNNSDTSANTGIRPDTSVTGVPGNTNAVNAAGNAGNGSGMGSSSNTEAEKKH